MLLEFLCANKLHHLSNLSTREGTATLRMLKLTLAGFASMPDLEPVFVPHVGGC